MGAAGGADAVAATTPAGELGGALVRGGRARDLPRSRDEVGVEGGVGTILDARAVALTVEVSVRVISAAMKERSSK